MARSEKHHAKEDGKPQVGLSTSPEVRGETGAKSISSENSNTLALRPAPGPDEDGSSQSHEDQGVKKHQRGRQRGRPVKYQGDPDAPGLDPSQRRQLLRRISNRESARRTRKRQEEQLGTMYAKVESLHENCRALTAQVDTLKLQLLQSEALEKRLTEVLQMKDRQIEASKHEIDSLKSRIRSLALQLKEQKMLRLEMHLEVQGCMSAMSSPRAQRPCTEMLVRPGSGSLSQTYDPYVPYESAAEPVCDEIWSPYLDAPTSQALYQAGQLHAGMEAGPTCAMSPYRRLPQKTLPSADMDLPDVTGPSEAANRAQDNFIDMMRQVGLLSDADTGTKTALA